jgi:hypothetical protein
MSKPATSNSNLKLHAMLERFAKAFTGGDGPAAARCWEVPALIVAEMGTRSVASIEEVERFYGGAVKQYHQMGVSDTRPEVQQVNWLTDHLATVQVRWPYLDAQGHALGDSESSTYVVRIGDDGEPRISVVVMHGARGGA